MANLIGKMAIFVDSLEELTDQIISHQQKLEKLKEVNEINDFDLIPDFDKLQIKILIYEEDEHNTNGD